MSRGSLFYDWYDVLFASKAYASEIDVALELAETHLGAPPERLLEIGCGTGNHTLELARRGVDVVAVDTDKTMVLRATKKLAAAGATAVVLNTRCENLEHSGFDAALALFNVVNYVSSVQALESLFGAVADRLNRPGFFLFDSWNGVAALADPPRAKHTEINHHGAHVVCDLSAETDRMMQRTTLTYQMAVTQDGVTIEDAFSFSQTLWTPMQIRDALERAAIQLVACTRLFEPGIRATAADWKLMWIGRV
jgi:SAM-dependent methyltransferase